MAENGIINVFGNTGISDDEQNGIAVVSGNTGPPDDPQSGIGSYFGNTGLGPVGPDAYEFVYGLTPTTLLTEAYFSADASVTSVFYQNGGAASSAQPTTPALPSNTAVGDWLFLFHHYKGYAGILYNGTNSPWALGFHEFDSSRVSGYYTYSSTYGVDTGESRTLAWGGEVDPNYNLAGSPAFSLSNSGGTNITKFLRFTKSKDLEWNVLAFADNYPSGTTRYMRPYGSHSAVDVDDDTRFTKEIQYSEEEGYYLAVGISGHGSIYENQDIWKSSDGANWNKVGTLPDKEQLGRPSYGNNAWLIRGRSTYDMYTSFDGGTTWSVETGNTGFTADPFFRDGRFWASKSSTYWNSTDGVTWTQVDLPNPPVGYPWVRGIDFNPNTGTLVAIGDQGNTWVSHNRGDTWTHKANVLTSASTYFDALAVKCGKKTTGEDFWVITGAGDSTSGGGAAYSSDDGDTWTIHSTTQTPFHDNSWNVGAESIDFNGSYWWVGCGLNIAMRAYASSGSSLSWSLMSGNSREYVYSNADLFSDGLDSMQWVEDQQKWVTADYSFKHLGGVSGTVPDIQAGDLMLWAIASPSDSQTYSNQTLTVPGCTVGTHTYFTETTTTDNDMSVHYGYAYIDSGTCTSAIYWSGTGSLTGSPSDDASCWTARLRAVPQDHRLRAVAKLTGEAAVVKVGLQPGTPGADYTAHMTVDSYVEPSSSAAYDPGFTRQMFSESESNSITFYPMVTSPGFSAGQLVVVWAASDNSSGSEPASATVTDAAGNTYTNLGYVFNGHSKANDGTTMGIWYSILTTELLYNVDSMTITWNSSVDAKVAMVRAYTGIGAGGLRSTTVTNSGTSATPTITSGTVSAGDMVVAGHSVENSTLMGLDSDTLNGSWVQTRGNSGSGGNSSTHQGLLVGHKITNASGAQTFNPATSPSADWASVIAVFAFVNSVSTAAVLRPIASMTVTASVTKTYSTTVTLSAVASDISADAEKDDGVTPIGVLDAVASATADAEIVRVTAAVLNAIATGMYVFASDWWTTASDDLDAVADMTVEAKIAEIFDADASLDAVAQVDTVGGLPHFTDAALAAVASDLYIPSAGVYIITDSDENDQDETPYWPPEGYPDFPDSPWYKFTSQYGPTGSEGNLVELTNRHYQDVVFSTLLWSHPNGPNGSYYPTYTMGARASAVTPLGDDKFLVTWVQENWHQYFQDWVGYTPVYRDQSDLPLSLVATVLDCSGTGDPIITGTKRYDMPSDLRFWRNGSGQDAKVDSNGDVIGVFSGFSIMPIPWNPDYGTWSAVQTDPINIMFKVSAGSADPTFEWVKTFGVVESNTHGFYNQILFDGDNPVVVTSGYNNTRAVKFSGSTGAHIDTSDTIGVTNGWEGALACIYKGGTGIVFGDTNGAMKYTTLDLSGLTWGTLENVAPTTYLSGHMWKAKKGKDGYWYTSLEDSTAPYLQIFKWDIVDGELSLVSKHISDVPHVSASAMSLDSYKYKNYSISSDMLEFWVPYGYNSGSYSALVSIYSKIGFCPGAQNPSIVQMAYGLGTTSQSPEHRAGPQVIGRIPATTSAEVPIKPTGWLSPPILDSWSSYFDPYPTFGEMDVAEMNNGKLLVVFSDSYSAQDSHNGVFRIFSYIADPQNEPPPLKMSQRDDDKRAGGKRLGYNPGQESTIRSGWVAW